MKITKAYLQRAYPNESLRRYAYRGNMDNEHISELPLYLGELIAYSAALNYFKEREDYNLLEKIAGLDFYNGFKEMGKQDIKIKLGKKIIGYENIFHFVNSVKKKAKNSGNLTVSDVRTNELLNPKSNDADFYRRLGKVDKVLMNNYKNVLKFISEGRGRAKNEYPSNYDKGLSEILSESNIPVNPKKEVYQPKLF